METPGEKLYVEYKDYTIRTIGAVGDGRAHGEFEIWKMVHGGRVEVPGGRLDEAQGLALTAGKKWIDGQVG